MRKLIIRKMDDLPFLVEESINRLRVNLGFCGDAYKKIIVTSTSPNEGKSFVTLHLWKTLAEAGNKVVLVDADMRKSEMRMRYDIAVDDGGEIKGLVHYLSGQVSLNDVVYHTSVRDGFFLPVGQLVTNAALLLEDKRFTFMLDSLSQSFDYVLLDTPPLGSVADSERIASQCDGALLVVRSGMVPKRLVGTSIKQLERSNCKLLGVVLNGVRRGGGRYYRYSYYNKYGYGKS